MNAPDHKAPQEPVDISPTVLTYMGQPLTKHQAVVMFANQDGLIRLFRERSEKAEAELEKLRQRCGELEADARRYRWLRDSADIDDVFYDDKVTLSFPAPDIDGFNDLNDVIDIAIDRAGGGESLVEIVGGEE